MADLKKLVTRRKKRLGRGYGSGKGGHTSSRGQKGQKSRGSVGILFEGVKMKKSLIKRLPLRRGKGKFLPGVKPLVVNLEVLNVLKEGSVIDIPALVKAGIVNETRAKTYGVKILGVGLIEKKFNVALPISKSAAAKILKAGGKVGSSS